MEFTEKVLIFCEMPTPHTRVALVEKNIVIVMWMGYGENDFFQWL